MTITLNGTTGITAPTYNGSVTSEYSVPVTAFKNRIINGAMMIDQRWSGASMATDGVNGYSLDRWGSFYDQNNKFTIQQNAGSITPPAGFSNYLGVTSSSAYTVGASERFVITQKIEGFNTADLAWGTASAATVTLSFWVRSSLTGTFGGSLENSANSRSYPFSYTISSANTWEYKTITITGDTTGTWVGATNGIGIRVQFGIGVGSTLSGTAGAWAAANYQSATGAVSVVGTNGATFYITGVQLEKGSNATSFDYRPYGTELALCQRYCWVFDASSGSSGNGARFVGMGRGTTNADVFFTFPVPTRIPPTGITVSAASHFNTFNPATASGQCTGLTFNLGAIGQAVLTATTTAGSPTLSAGAVIQLEPNSTSAKITFNGCEL